MSFIWRKFDSMQQMRHVDSYRRCSLSWKMFSAVHGVQTATCCAINNMSKYCRQWCCKGLFQTVPCNATVCNILTRCLCRRQFCSHLTRTLILWCWLKSVSVKGVWCTKAVCNKSCYRSFPGYAAASGGLTYVMAAILKVWRHIRNLTPSVNRCVCTWRTFTPNFVPIRFEMTEP